MRARDGRAGPMDQLNKFDRGRFSGTNSLIFRPAWSEAETEWWYEHILRDHGLYPDDLGERLSASVQGPKVVHFRIST